MSGSVLTRNDHGPSFGGQRRSRRDPGDGASLSKRESLPAPRAAFIDEETERAIDLDERATDTARLRVVGAATLVMWAATCVPDFGLARGVLQTSVEPFFVAKLVGALPLALVLVRLLPWFPLPSRHALYAAALFVFVPPAAATSLLAVRFASDATTAGHVVVTLLVALGVALPLPLKRSLPLTAAVALAFAVTVAVAAFVDDGVAARLHVPEQRAVLFMIVVSHLAAGALVVVGAHVQYDLRRQALVAQHKSRYRLEKLLGEGGMGEVWRAWHPGLGRHVALKMLRNGGSDELVRRFTREIKATAELVHPHTVRVLDCGLTDDGHWYYTMELLTGRTLASLVAAEGPLPASRAVYLLIQAARALAEAHMHNLVHRDVKPENLFVTRTGGETDFVKVLDFGIARAVLDEASITRDGMVIGTPRYMAPEQERGAPADARSDVYALGATLYLALTGVPPLPGDTIEQVQGARLRGELIPPSWRVPGVPPLLESIVMRCLRTDPAERYADAGHLADALIATGLHRLHVPPPASEEPVMEPVRRGPSTRNLAVEPATTGAALPPAAAAALEGAR